MGKDKASGMKSAYELALERLEEQGIERPREDVSEELRNEIAEVRRRAEAKLAELEILYKDKRQHAFDPAADEEYVRERRRIEDDQERKIEKLRQGGP